MPVEDDLVRFQAMSEELNMEEEEAANFVQASMKRKGYKPRLAWDEPDPEQGNGDKGDFFSVRRQEKSGDKQSKKSGADWQYGS